MYAVMVTHRELTGRFEIAAYAKRSDAIRRMNQEAAILEMNGKPLYRASETELHLLKPKSDGMTETTFYVRKK